MAKTTKSKRASEDVATVHDQKLAASKAASFIKSHRARRLS
jgi:hypothetical protein